jgi:hypothetical protein
VPKRNTDINDAIWIAELLAQRDCRSSLFLQLNRPKKLYCGITPKGRMRENSWLPD